MLRRVNGTGSLVSSDHERPKSPFVADNFENLGQSVANHIMDQDRVVFFPFSTPAVISSKRNFGPCLSVFM